MGFDPEGGAASYQQRTLYTSPGCEVDIFVYESEPTILHIKVGEKEVELDVMDIVYSNVNEMKAHLGAKDWRK